MDEPRHSSSRGTTDGRGTTTIDIEDIERGLVEPPWVTPQAALDRFFADLEAVDAPPGYTYSGFVEYLSDPAAAQTEAGAEAGDFAARMACRNDPGASPLRQVRRKIEQIVGPEATVYLADSRAYLPEALPAEFPELRIFNISLAEAFAETGAPAFRVETVRFADLRSLSRMRREIRRTGLRAAGERQPTAVQLVSILLGLAK